jgi:DNA helicase-2/ATP-dependent DNA helicase PcrA
MELDTDQQHALNNLTNRSLIVAGAGSGKTRLLIATLIKLLSEGKNNIVLLTFTRKAAEEMRRRAEEETDHQLRDLDCGTFHGVALKWLRREGIVDRVLDEEESLIWLQEIIEHTAQARDEEDLPRPSPNQILEWSSRIAEENIHMSLLAGDRADFCLAVQKKYKEMKSAENLADYTDLLVGVSEWLDRKDGKNHIESLQAVLVDEAQDLSSLQRKIIDQLTSHGAMRIMIGDPAQCIYSWRGAAADALEKYAQLDNVTLERLANNYRSTPEICSVAQIIMPDGPLALQAKPMRLSGAIPRLIHCSDVEEEALAIKNWAHQHDDINDLCVLARTHNQARKAAEALEGTPIHHLGRDAENSRFQRPLKALLRLALDPRQIRAWYSLLSLLPGDNREAAMQIVSAEKPFPEAALLWPELNGVFMAIKEQEVSASLWRQLCYGPYGNLLAQAGHEQEAYNLAERNLDENCKGAEFLDSLLDGYTSEGRGIKLGTVHAAKGLEWKHVLIMRLGEGSFPLHTQTRQQEKEERRLFYVAATRAEDTLTLLESEWQRGRGFLQNQNLLSLLDN